MKNYTRLFVIHDAVGGVLGEDGQLHARQAHLRSGGEREGDSGAEPGPRVAAQTGSCEAQNRSQRRGAGSRGRVLAADVGSWCWWLACSRHTARLARHACSAVAPQRLCAVPPLHGRALAPTIISHILCALATTSCIVCRRGILRAQTVSAQKGRPAALHSTRSTRAQCAVQLQPALRWAVGSALVLEDCGSNAVRRRADVSMARHLYAAVMCEVKVGYAGERRGAHCADVSIIRKI